MPEKSPANEPNFIFQIAGTDLRVLEFTASEMMSGLFKLDLKLALKDDEVQFDDMIGNEALLTILSDEKDRYFHGIVNRFVHLGAKGRFNLYEARVVPMVYLLSLERDCRIFQNKNTPDIVKKVLQETGITGDVVKFRLQGSHDPLEYCVQYRETDLNFISRKVEEEGIFYFFEHEKDKHVLVFGDGTVNYKSIEGEKKVVYRPDGELVPDEEYVTRFSLSRRIRSGKVSMRDYNFEQPSVDLTAEEKGDAFKMLEIYDYPGIYLTQGKGKALSKIRLQESEASIDIARGKSACPRFTPGYKFELVEHDIDSFNAEYLFTRVTHKGVQPQVLEEYADSKKSFSYINFFTAIPASVVFRPERRAVKPVVEGSQTAQVVGPKGEEIYTDKHGRIKVQFHWDREGKYDENSSCWIRVAQSWAGKSWGSVFLPRIGHEVVVDFLEGDPDKPLVTGSLYNADTVPPYSLPGEKTKSTVKSRSSIGGGGFNEIRFEDKKGSEQIFIHGEKDQDIRIKNDLREWIGGESHQIVKKSMFEKVFEDKHVTLKGDYNEKTDGTISIQGAIDKLQKIGNRYALDTGLEIHLKSGMNLVIESGLSLTLKAAGNYITIDPTGVTIKGLPLTKINSGGSAGDGGGSDPEKPKEAVEAASAKPGKKAKMRSGREPERKDHKPSPVVAARAKMMKNAAKSGKPFCAKCEAAKKARSAAATKERSTAPKKERSEADRKERS